MLKIPNQNQFSQTNESDRTGNIYITKNIDFDKRGYVGLADRTVSLGNGVVLSDLTATTTDLSAITYSSWDAKYWAVGSKNLYRTDVLNVNAWSKDTTTGTPTMDQFGRNDLTQWENAIFACNYANIYKHDTSQWVVFSTVNVKMLRVFENLNQLAAASDNEVYTLDDGGNIIQTLVVPTGYTITGIAWNNMRLHISIRNNMGVGGGGIIEWDGLSNAYNTFYRVDAQSVYALAPYKSGVAGVTSFGELVYYQGGIQTLAYFPIHFKAENWLNFAVYQRGILSRGDNVYIAVNAFNFNNSRDLERARFENDFIGGVWCFDPKVGLYNKYNIGGGLVTKTNAITTGNVDTGTGVITVAGATVPATGTPLFYVPAGAVIGGLKASFKYYTIKLSDTTLKLATTYSNAIAGTAITLTGTGNNSQYITFHPNTDFGGIFNNPICLADAVMNTNSFGNANAFDILIGGQQIIGDSTTLRATINAVAKYQENRGYVITPKLLSGQLTDNTRSFSIKFKKLLTEEDKIIIKYRRKDEDKPRWLSQNSPAITWTSATTFTSTDDLSKVVVGDEVEITRGSGAGYLAHVTAISENAGTYTVTIDETIQNIAVNDRAYVVFDNWTKIKTITNTSNSNDLGYELIRIGEPSKWVQFKIELRGNGVQLEEMIIDNEIHTPLH
jgi:hypothetical protein